MIAAGRPPERREDRCVHLLREHDSALRRLPDLRSDEDLLGTDLLDLPRGIGLDDLSSDRPRQR